MYHDNVPDNGEMKACHIVLILMFLGLTLPLGLNNRQAISRVWPTSAVQISAAASAVAPEQPELAWYTVRLPVLKRHFNVWVLIAIGFSVGVLRRFFGIGGVCFVTPALNIFGFPISLAIGTDLAQMTAKACLGAIKDGWRAHVDTKLIVLLLIGMVMGIETGARTVMWLAELNMAGTVIRMVYLAVLLVLGLFMIIEYRKVTSVQHNGTFLDQSWLPPLNEGGTAVSRRLQAMKLPPVVNLSASGVGVSLWIIVGIAFMTGWLFGLLGVIGAFLPLPAMIYVMGIPPAIALGTDLFCTVLSGSYGSLTYALKGQVEFIALLWILLGTLVGSQACTRTARYVRGPSIRLLYGITMITVGLSVVLKQFNVIAPAQVVLLLSILAPCAIIIVRMAKGYVRDRRE